MWLLTRSLVNMPIKTIHMTLWRKTNLFFHALKFDCFVFPSDSMLYWVQLVTNVSWIFDFLVGFFSGKKVLKSTSQTYSREKPIFLVCWYAIVSANTSHERLKLPVIIIGLEFVLVTKCSKNSPFEVTATTF